MPIFTGPTPILIGIKHKASGKDGVIPPHVQISKQHSLLYNHSEHKAVFELKPNTVMVSEFFTKADLKGYKKGGNPKAFKDAMMIQKALLEAREQGRAASAGHNHPLGCRWVVSICGLSVVVYPAAG